MPRPIKPEKAFSSYLLGRNVRLERLFHKMTQLQQLTEYIALSLPANWRSDCFVVNCEGNRLTLGTHDAALGTHLKYAVPTLLSEIKRRPGLQHITQIRCRVLPPPPVMALVKPERITRSVSSGTQTLLRDCADQLANTEDTNELKAILYRISCYQ